MKTPSTISRFFCLECPIVRAHDENADRVKTIAIKLNAIEAGACAVAAASDPAVSRSNCNTNTRALERADSDIPSDARTSGNQRTRVPILKSDVHTNLKSDNQPTRDPILKSDSQPTRVPILKSDTRKIIQNLECICEAMSNCRIEHETPNLDNDTSVSKYFGGYETLSKEDVISEDDAHAITSPEKSNLSQESNGTDECDREFRQSQLNTSAEPVYVENFYNMSPREMPHSPHCLIEEEFKQNPWAMLVATIFLTKTTGKAAKPFMRKFFMEYPTPYDVLKSNPERLEAYFTTLGMRKRGHMIWKMSHDFVSARWRRASDLYGIGKYGEDAYRLFCLGHTDVEPTDRYLRLYLDWLKSTDHDEEYSREACENVIIDPVSQYYAISLR